MLVGYVQVHTGFGGQRLTKRDDKADFEAGGPVIAG